MRCRYFFVILFNHTKLKAPGNQIILHKNTSITFKLKKNTTNIN